MGMSAAEIEAHIKEAFPDAEVTLTDLAGDNNHFSVKIASAAFQGQSRIQQHKLVYAALQGKMGGVLHALAVQTVAK